MVMLVTCASCKADKPYIVKDYLNDLSSSSGIDDSNNIDSVFVALEKWGIVTNEDKSLLNDRLNYAFLAKTIYNLLEYSGNPIDELYKKGIIDNKNPDKYVDYVSARNCIDKAIKLINNKKFEYKNYIEYVDNIKTKDDDLHINDVFEDDGYKIVTNINEEAIEYREAEYEDVFRYMDVANTYEVDFSEAEIIPLNEELDTSYKNNIYNLLASKNHVFNSNGFRISYSINSSGIDVHVSKKVDKINIFADASINNVKPTFKWTYDSGDLKNCYFNIKFNTTSSLGASFGKYGNYYVKLKDLDGDTFIEKVKSMIVPKADEVEAIIPICEIKTPIPNIPLCSLNMTIGIKLYVSGKIEVVMYNTHNAGVEIKNGVSRFFYNHNDDLDIIASTSGKSAIALNVGIDASKFRLCDVELDGGVKAELKSTVHLYDTDFNESVVESDIEYDTLNELARDNPYVKVCGDVSLYWLIDVICNTYKSVLYKMGFSKIFHISDENNQVFNNMHHIENGQFVKTCTRKGKSVIHNETLNINSNNKIVLNTYAEVLDTGQNFTIEVLGIPDKYTYNDIKVSSTDNSVARVNGYTIAALKPGACKINVHTSDNKYNSYISILVSAG